MRHKRRFDRRFMLDVEAALQSLASEALPIGGYMTPSELIGPAAVRYSLVEVPFDVPRQTSPWLGRLLLRLVLDLGVRMPRNLRLRGHKGEVVRLANMFGGIAELREGLKRLSRSYPAGGQMEQTYLSLPMLGLIVGATSYPVGFFEWR